MTLAPLRQEAVDYALQRLWEWSSVHRNSTDDERIQGASNLLIALGVNDLKVYIDSQLDERGIVSADWRSRGGFWLGVVVGLFIKDFEEQQ